MDQSADENLYLEAFTYLLGAGWVSEAIKLLLKNKLHSEALCLAMGGLNSTNVVYKCKSLVVLKTTAIN